MLLFKLKSASTKDSELLFKQYVFSLKGQAIFGKTSEIVYYNVLHNTCFRPLHVQLCMKDYCSSQVFKTRIKTVLGR